MLGKTYLGRRGLLGRICPYNLREHIGINDEQKIAALQRIHDILEHVTLQHAFQHQASRTRVKGGPV
jgi:hypothetical protein